jgi:hypothetical protein
MNWIVCTERTYHWWLRMKLSYRALVGTWRYTRGVSLQTGDTLNIHHRFMLVRRVPKDLA